MLTNISIQAAIIFLSMVLGAVALVFVSVQFPNVFELMLDGASWAETQIGSTGLDTRYNNWVRFLIGEEQLVFMSFTIVMRVVLAFLVTGVRGMFGGNA